MMSQDSRSSNDCHLHMERVCSYSYISLQSSNLEQTCSIGRVLSRGLPSDVKTACLVLNSVQFSGHVGFEEFVTRIMVYLRETIALTRSSELQEMYAAFIVAVANNY